MYTLLHKTMNYKLQKATKSFHKQMPNVYSAVVELRNFNKAVSALWSMAVGRLP